MSRAGFGLRSVDDRPDAAPSDAEPLTAAPLDRDAVVDVDAERAEVGIDDVIDRLDTDLVGLVPVKTRIREIAALLLVDRMRQRFRLVTSRPTLHMSFTGSPGTGKTTVAMRMAELLHRLGYLSRGHLVTATRDDLVGQYVGHTAPRTKEVLNRAMGGVLFVDEAYYLYRAENDRDYGQEAIEILLQVMENRRDDLVVVFAGYRDRMDTFFAANPGMASRIAHHIEFPDYSLDELFEIGGRMLAQQEYELSPEAEGTFRDYLVRRMDQPRFANARSVRNALERARLRHANRLVARAATVDRRALMTLVPDDFLASRVFRPAVDDRRPGAGAGSLEVPHPPPTGPSACGDQAIRPCDSSAGPALDMSAVVDADV